MEHHDNNDNDDAASDEEMPLAKGANAPGPRSCPASTLIMVFPVTIDQDWMCGNTMGNTKITAFQKSSSYARRVRQAPTESERNCFQSDLYSFFLDLDFSKVSGKTIRFLVETKRTKDILSPPMICGYLLLLVLLYPHSKKE